MRVLLSVIAALVAYPTGAPSDMCTSPPGKPEHGSADFTAGTGDYLIVVKGSDGVEVSQVAAGEQYTVEVSGSPFEGALLHASAGTLAPSGDGFQMTGACVTHTSRDAKDVLTATWTAPASGTTATLQANVVVSHQVFHGGGAIKLDVTVTGGTPTEAPPAGDTTTVEAVASGVAAFSMVTALGLAVLC
mmetsp:Transcript_32861/g.80286  ORF Transcript_32861/g.80286 Transcript_32861/m.80286 type:complete len:189 (+) Transcript_32861:32-598(+)